MFKKSLKKRILDAVSQKIDSLQKEHDEKVDALNKEHELAIIKIADDMVNSFLSKIL
jgi:hypothetical protein